MLFPAHLQSPLLYAGGTAILVPSSVLLYFPGAANGAILGFIMACLLLTLGAIVDAVKLLKPSAAPELMPLQGESEANQCLDAKSAAVWFNLLGGIFFETAR